MKRFILLLIFVLGSFILAYSQEKLNYVEKNLVSAKEEVKVSEEGELIAPLVSPSGKFLAFSKDNYKGIYILSLSDGKVIQITDLDGAGFGFEWQGYEDIIAFRGSVGNLRRKHLICVAHTDGSIEVSSPLLETVSLPIFINRDLVFAVWGKKESLKIVGPTRNETCSYKVFMASPEGEIVCFNGEKTEKRKENKVFFLPRYSKDGKKFLVHSLDGGIYLGSVEDGSLKKIAEGSNGRFAKEDSAIIFEKTKDDGHRIIESDIFLYDLKNETLFQLTDTKAIIERMPAMAEDGHTLYWSEDGKIMRGWVK